ncbi:MAG TPA: undecaprenyl-diphosphate phosphatase [Saprospiraceae bacterium]|nr:undecaprenyl-diphosphate phosphatase [Saprospiraceae bacterium]HOJ91403.1 undecaprenyl-diphosphate phosphatase [Saprospiraceae bacterium]HUN17606.1 undecaprenyl-diphosphate phosphatase [Saprospiraceae bacterium]
MTLIQSIIIAIIEGITEFLPISSTGHMIIASTLMKINNDEFVKTFEICIQIGAIMAIMLMYVKKFLSGLNIYFKLMVAFLPTAIIGFLAYDIIKSYLFNPIVVATSLILGGIILIFIDQKVENQQTTVLEIESISYKNAFLIGLFQCISMIPGVSRAAATIIGGIFNGLNKKQATEFSFLLAVPTMLAASSYDLLKTNIHFNSQEIMILGLGLVIAFVTAWITVKFFLKFISHYGFKHFGYYRIVIGIIFLLFIKQL